MNIRRQLLLALSCAVFATAPALAGMWIQSSGGMPGIFEYYNGGDLNGLYGNPTINYDAFAQELTLTFLPNDFTASSTDGIGDPVQTTDTLFFDLMINPNFAPVVFNVVEGGSYNIIGDGTVNNESNLKLTELSGPDPLNPILGTSTDFPLAFQLDNPGTGAWISSADLNASSDFDENLLYFRVELSNLLEATSSLGSTASISKLGSEIEFKIRFIPVPGAAMLGVLGLLCVLRRR